MQSRNSKSVNQLVKQWLAANPSTATRNPGCRDALSKYLCRAAMPPCDAMSSSCYAVFYPCKSMCTDALKACFGQNGTAAQEKGGFGWLTCKYLPMTDEAFDVEEERSPGSQNATDLVPVPTECCSTASYKKGEILPDPRKEECLGNTGNLSTQSTTHKAGIKPSCDGRKVPGGPCFIATAAYGSTMHPNLQYLRQYRDLVLERHSHGRAFVGWYYAHSPPIADWIAEREWARAAIRMALWPVVASLKAMRNIDTTYRLAEGATVVLLVGIVAVVLNFLFTMNVRCRRKNKIA